MAVLADKKRPAHPPAAGHGSAPDGQLLATSACAWPARLRASAWRVPGGHARAPGAGFGRHGAGRRSRVVRAAWHGQRQSRGRPPCQPGASRPGSGSMVAQESSLTSWRHAPVAKPMSMSKPMHQSKKVLRPDLVRQGRACSANQHLHAARAIPAGSAHNDEQGRASRRRSSRVPVQREGAS